MSEAHTPNNTTLRRRFLKRFGFGLSAAGLAGLAGGRDTIADEQEAPGLRHETLTLDIAVLGHTNYSNDGGAANKLPGGFQNFMKSDSRGTYYFYEGLVYPGGTIPDPDPKSPDGLTWDFEVEPMGTFFNRGWIIINNKSEAPYERRQHPHLLSHADYYLSGVVGPDNLTPADMIQSVGLENGMPPNDIVTRAVTGGTGKYMTARGEMTQKRVGRNTTGLIGMPAPPGFLPPAPNYRLTFDLWL